MDDLSDLDIVITRPIVQASLWAEQLKALGARVNIIPLLDIVPIHEEEHIRAVKNCILDLDLYNKVIFVSQNAVEYGLRWIENYWPQLPVGLDFFAVGETTARQLQVYGVTVTDLAQAQSGAMTSETLLQSPALQHVLNDKILIFRGLGGRPHLGEELKARGARVDYCELYVRDLPVAAATQFAALFAQPSAQRQIIVLHSGESLQNLQAVLRQIDSQDPGLTDPLEKISGERSRAQKMSLLVPSVRVLEQAQAAGFAQVFAAQNATDTSMLQGLMDLKRNLEKV